MNSISDRYVIANGGNNPHFSPLEVISCTYDQTYTINYKNYVDHPEELSPLACQGGYPEAACLFSEKNGVGFDNGKTQQWLDSGWVVVQTQIQWNVIIIFCLIAHNFRRTILKLWKVVLNH